MHEQNCHWNERLGLKTHSYSFVNTIRNLSLLKTKQASHIKSQQHMFLYNCAKVFSSFNTKEQTREMSYLQPIRQGKP